MKFNFLSYSQILPAERVKLIEVNKSWVCVNDRSFWSLISFLHYNHSKGSFFPAFILTRRHWIWVSKSSTNTGDYFLGNVFGYQTYSLHFLLGQISARRNNCFLSTDKVSLWMTLGPYHLPCCYVPFFAITTRDTLECHWRK